jgi:hypothetical protein
VRALPVRQPWAWAIIHGGKDVENRTRNLAGSYRGPLLIHAGRQLDEAGFFDPLIGNGTLSNYLADNSSLLDPFALGKVIGVVDLVSVHHDSDHGRGCPCSPWAIADDWHLAVANARPLSTPIPAKGRLGLWTPDTELVDQVLEQLEVAA